MTILPPKVCLIAVAIKNEVACDSNYLNNPILVALHGEALVFGAAFEDELEDEIEEIVLFAHCQAQDTLDGTLPNSRTTKLPVAEKY